MLFSDYNSPEAKQERHDKLDRFINNIHTFENPEERIEIYTGLPENIFAERLINRSVEEYRLPASIKMLLENVSTDTDTKVREAGYSASSQIIQNLSSDYHFAPDETAHIISIFQKKADQEKAIDPAFGQTVQTIVNNTMREPHVIMGLLVSGAVSITNHMNGETLSGGFNMPKEFDSWQHFLEQEMIIQSCINGLYKTETKPSFATIMRRHYK